MPQDAMSESVRLRELCAEDEGRIFDILSQKKVIRYTLFPLFNRDQTREFVKISLKEQAKKKRKYLNMAVALADPDMLVGLCGLVLNPANEDGEVWYLLDPLYWNKGIATQAVRTIIRKGFEAYRLHRIWATCLPENPSSARVLEKAGFRKEGYLKEHLKIRGDWKDCYLFAILGHEWRTRPESL